MTMSTKVVATMTDAQDRIAQLHARRAAASSAAPAATARRRSTATGSKIAAVGVGMTVMFGLVGAMALAQNRGSSTPQPVQPTAPAQIVVVIHPGTASGAGTATGTGVPTVNASSKPIQLAAQPVVRQAPAQAPAAKTSGSR